MPFGSIFSKFSYIQLETADGKEVKMNNNFLSRIALKIFGFPYIGLRLRARKIISNFPKEAETMLDAGCGSGIYSFTFSNKTKEINAIDINQKKIDYAKRINLWRNIKFDKMDICNLKFPDDKFDVIICSEVLEHIKNDEKAFSEIARVLSKNGILLLTVPANSKKNRLVYKKYGHKKAGYEKEDIEKLCKKNNLKILKTEGYSSFLTEKFSEINYNLIKNKFLLCLVFYPLYLASLISDIFLKDYDGLFFKIKKIV